MGNETGVENISKISISGGRYSIIVPAENVVYGSGSIEDAINTKASLEIIAPAYNTTTEYHVGDYVIYNNNLYKCISATYGAWDNSKWNSTLASNEFGSSVLYDTTANWNSQSTLVAQRGVVYCYSDHQTSGQTNIPGIKIGDGTSYLIDMPFIDKLYIDHLSDTTSHITSAERTAWNNKVSCHLDPTNASNVIFTTD